MLKELLPKIRAFLIGSVILAVASGVAVVAAAYGLYAVLRLHFAAPEAAGITAGAFVVVALIAALGLSRVFASKSRPDKHAKAAPCNPEAMAMGMEAGAAVIGLVTDMLSARRSAARGKGKSRRSR